ncbi:MAG: hypothetical protein JWL76_2220 [Thermoleophilia bacterium]|nr:hypothetical protein [Thermoleophilia bacterium]
MTDFQILRSVAKSGLRFVDTAVDTKVAGEVVSAVLTTEKGVANPLGKVPIIAMTGLGSGSFFNRANTIVRQPATGGGVGSFDDAVQALHNLASRHGIDGIKLSENPAEVGLVRVKGELGFGGSTALNERVGKEALLRIDRAARLVQEFVDARA